MTGSVSSQGGHFGRKPREERGFTAGATGLVDCRLPRELGRPESGEIFHPTDGAIIVNKHVETCSKIHSDFSWYANISLGLEVVQLLLYSKAIPHLCISIQYITV